MASWRDSILTNFVSGVSKLTLVADPDGLLVEEKLAHELRQRGFDLIEFGDPIEFRYAYESKYRALWDRGEQTDLVVALRLEDGELEALPYDLLQAGRKLTFNLGELFPSLSYPVIEELDRGLLDLLFEAQESSRLESMGDDASKDFVLRHVFGVAAELIRTDVDLLRALLRLHYGKQNVPPKLAERLVAVLEKQSVFKEWPLASIVTNSAAFYAFLQERWPNFIRQIDPAFSVKEPAPASDLMFPRPTVLPFNHEDIRIYIDNLFLENKLTPIEAVGTSLAAERWASVGVIRASASNEQQRITRLFERIKEERPSAGARHSVWLSFAQLWAELSSLVYRSQDKELIKRLRAVGTQINEQFAHWMIERYASLANLPSQNPPMLHHVPQRLARVMEERSDSRVAIIVADGLSLSQWVSIRQLLQQQNKKLLTDELATFAWVPTITSVSRQTIFAGKPPFYFPNTINTTNNEEKLWRQFWEAYGLSRFEVGYKRSLGLGNAKSDLEESFNLAKVRALGLVVDTPDEIMHGNMLGAIGMHAQLRLWAEDGYLSELIFHLLEHGFDVWLTADHGNVDSVGKGRPSEGAVAEQKGERVRVYPTPELRNRVAQQFSFAHQWEPVGLPGNYFPLVTCGYDAFIRPGDSIVGHGGIALEEVIVPLVNFKMRVD